MVVICVYTPREFAATSLYYARCPGSLIKDVCRRAERPGLRLWIKIGSLFAAIGLINLLRGSFYAVLF